MLTRKIQNKQDLLSLLSSAQIRKIVGLDINSQQDIAKVARDAQSLLREKRQLTAFLIET